MQKTFFGTLILQNTLQPLVFVAKIVRSSRLQMFFKIGVLKIFASFTGKHLCWSPLLMKLQAWRSANFIKTRLQHGCFPVKFIKFLRTPFVQNTSGGCFWIVNLKWYTLWKSTQIRSFFWSVFSCIWTEYRKIRARKTPYLDTFHALITTWF